MNDPIRHPSHYTYGTIECWDAQLSMVGLTSFVDACRCQAVKYIWRAGRKHEATIAEDLRKAVEWLNKALKEIEARDNHERDPNSR